MSLWNGLKNAQVFERGNYFGIGTFDLKVIRCLTKQTQRSGLGFIVEFEVLTSDNPAHKIGSTGTWFQSMKSPQTAFSSIKEFVVALHGFDAREDAQRVEAELAPYLEQLMDHATGADNGFSGKLVHLETHQIKTRERGADFTVHRWSPFDEDRAAAAPPPPAMPAPAPAPVAAPRITAPPSLPPHLATRAPANVQAVQAPPVPVLVNGRWVLP